MDCPICSGPVSAPLFIYTAKQSASLLCPPNKDPDRHQRMVDVISDLWRGGDCEILRCKSCGFAFGNPFVGGDARFYAIMQETSGYPGWRQDYDFAIAHCLSKRKPGRIIDIGAGDGAFLSGIPAAWEKFATEGGEVTRRALLGKGIDVYFDLFEASSQPETYDVVTMFQFLEHISNPLQILRDARGLLKRGGQVVITVPDCEAMLRMSTMTPHVDMPPMHVCKWTPEALRVAITDAGFRPDVTEYAPVGIQDALMYLSFYVLADSRKRWHPAAYASRVKSRRVRHVLFGLLSVLSLPRLLPALPRLMRSSSFGMVATAV